MLNTALISGSLLRNKFVVAGYRLPKNNAEYEHADDAGHPCTQPTPSGETSRQPKTKSLHGTFLFL